MSFSAAVWLVILFAVIAANLPFVNERLFVVGPLRQPKSLGLRLVELVRLVRRWRSASASRSRRASARSSARAGSSTSRWRACS